MPARIQLRRTKGWKMPENTVKVDRSTPWGNAWRIREADGSPEYGIVIPAITAAQAVALLRSYIISRLWQNLNLLAPLCGKNIGCWCSLSDQCHGDTYLEFANLPRDALMKRMLECEQVPA